MTAQLERTDGPRWQETATIAALLSCYDVWSASPTFDCDFAAPPASTPSDES